MASQADKEQALLKKRLEGLLKIAPNLSCADCPSRCACARGAGGERVCRAAAMRGACA